MIPYLLSLLLLTDPTPAPSPLPVIVHTKTSPLCTALHSYAMPIGYVTRRNDDAFRAISHSLRAYLSGIYPGDVPTAAEMASTMHGEPEGAQADATGAERLDDQLLFGPGQTLTVAEVDDVANQIYSNLLVERKFMDQWWHDVPEHSDPQIDAMRQHLQNLMDLQRALADRYERFAGLYLGDRGMAALESPQQRAQFKVFLRALLLGEAAALLDDPNQPMNDGYSSVSQRARLGNVAQVVRNLRDEEHQYAASALSTVNSCDGMKFQLQTPGPTP
jgi:hypothetical protein